MTPLVPIALFGWIPAILLIYILLPPRRAVVAAFIAGWCFLPMYGYLLQGFPEYNKENATCLGVLIATACFAGDKFASFRPRLMDLPMLLWCISPFLSHTMGGGVGSYEGASTTVKYIFTWGIPYFIGRLYFTDLRAMRELALGLFIGAMIYVPLCLFEIRFSPQLHAMVYGFFQDDFGMTRRGGGWRPTVFMRHGLAVGLFMCTGALVGVWLWKCKSVRALLGLPMFLWSLVVFITAILCKSTGSSVLMILGLASLWGAAILRTPWTVRILIVVPVLYIFTRTIGGWDGQELLDLAQLVSDERQGSLNWRLASENDCWDLIQPNLFLGHGRFVFSGLRLQGRTTAVTPDGMWIICLVCNGLFGLTMFYTALLGPAWAMTRRIQRAHWGHPAVAPAAAVAVAVTIYAIDNLFNAMPNPLFVLGAGALVSTAAVVPSARRTVRVKRPAGPPGLQPGPGVRPAES